MRLLSIVGYTLSVRMLVLGDTNSTTLKLVNNAGAPIELYWVKSDDSEKILVKQTLKSLRDGTDAVVIKPSSFTQPR